MDPVVIHSGKVCLLRIRDAAPSDVVLTKGCHFHKRERTREIGWEGGRRFTEKDERHKLEPRKTASKQQIS